MLRMRLVMPVYGGYSSVAMLKRVRTTARSCENALKPNSPCAEPMPELLTPPNGRLPCAKCMTTRSEEHTSELQSLMRSSYAVFCLKKKKTQERRKHRDH